MLAEGKFITPIAVHDIENAVDFYGTILGLERVGTNSEGAVFQTNGGLIGIHESPTAGSGQATIAWWTVDDVEATVKDLKSKGVTFEQNYDLPYAKRRGDIYILSDTKKAAWFRDLDGNILGVGNF